MEVGPRPFGQAMTLTWEEWQNDGTAMSVLVLPSTGCIASGRFRQVPTWLVSQRGCSAAPSRASHRYEREATVAARSVAVAGARTSAI